MTQPIWLPVDGGIVPRMTPLGPLQTNEKFATWHGTLEKTRLEYSLRRFDAVYGLLKELLAALEPETEARYVLLRASALVLQARLLWRQADGGTPELPQYYVRGAPAYLSSPVDAPHTRCFEQAIALFQVHGAAIPEQPSESRLHTDHGIALHRTGQHQAALAALNRAIETGAAPGEAFVYLGMTHVALEGYEEALRALHKGLQLLPGDKLLLEAVAITLEKIGPQRHDEAVRRYCQAAVAAGEENDLPAARGFLQSALALRPHDPQALSMLTLLLQSQGEVDQAMRRLEQTLAKRPDDPWALGLQGMLLRAKGELQVADAVLAQVKVTTPDLAWVHLERALAVAPQDIARAREQVARAAAYFGTTDPRVEQVKSLIEFQAAKKGLQPVAKITTGLVDRLAAAAGDMAAAAVAAAVQAFGRHIWGMLLDAQNSDRVEDALRKVIEFFPKGAEPREQLAEIMLDRGEFAQADALLDDALKLAPYAPNLHRLKGRVFEAQGKLPEAIRHYRQAVREAPEDDQALDLLVDAQLRQGRPQDVLHELQRNAAILNGRGPALARLGEVLHVMGRLGEARDVLRQAEAALDKGPVDRLCATRIRLGRVLRASDEFTEAAEAYDRAMTLETDAPLEAHALKTSLLIDIAEYQAAAALAAETIARHPEARAGAASSRLGWLYAARGWALHCAGGAEPSELERLFRTALEVSPNDLYSWKNLGSLLLRDPKQRRDGEQILARLTEPAAGGQAPIALVGWCQLLLGQYEAAEQSLRAALSGSDGSAKPPGDGPISIHFDLALVLLAEGKGEAETAYQSALDLASRRPEPRRRGLLHIAAQDVVLSAKADRIDHARGHVVWQNLIAALESANYPYLNSVALAYPVRPVEI